MCTYPLTHPSNQLPARLTGVNILFQELISVLKRSFDFVLTRGGEELPMYQVEF